MRYLSFLIFIFLCNVNLFSQKVNKNNVFYQKAIEYIRQSENYKLDTVQNPDPAIHIGNRYCSDMLESCVCDIIKKDYNLNCNKIILNNYSKFKAIEDSVKMVYPYFGEKTKKIKYNKNIAKLSLENAVGYIVSFSKFRNNQLSAELFNYKFSYYNVTSPHFGKSRVYHFIFNKRGEIEKVYEGTIYYD